MRRGIGQMRRRIRDSFFRLDSENDQSRFPQMSEFENPVGGIAALDEELRFAPSKRFGGNELPQEVLGCFDGVMRGNEFSGLGLRDDVKQDQMCLKFLRERYGVGRRSG